MGLKQVSNEIPKDWFLKVDTAHGRRKIIAAADKRPIETVADVTQLITIAEAAKILSSKPKTVSDWVAKKLLKSVKIRGRRKTTAQWVQDFIDREAEKNG